MRNRLRVLACCVFLIACSQEGEKRLIEGIGAPQNVKAVLGEGTVTLSWDAVVGARSYNISYDTKSAARKGKGLSIGDSPADVGNVERVLIEKLQIGATYYFEVAAIAPDGEGPVSPEISVTLTGVLAAPAVPKNVQAKVGSESVALAWDASEGADSYKIYYGAKAGGPYIGKGAKEGDSPEVVAGALGATLTGLTNGQAYFFAVSAVNSKGESEKSSEVSGTPSGDLSGQPTSPGTGGKPGTGGEVQPPPPPPGAPAAPSDLVASALSASEIKLSWKDNSDNETGFTLERKTGAVAFSTLATLAADSTSHSDSGLTRDSSYVNRIHATNSVGSSAFSGEVLMTTLSEVTRMTACRSYSCALLSNGSVKCWGNNGSGRLGDGTTENRLTPVQVQGLP